MAESRSDAGDQRGPNRTVAAANFPDPVRHRSWRTTWSRCGTWRWLKQQYPLRTHRYDLVGISYEEGDRIITPGNAPGRLVNTKAWVFQTNRANVTHVEEGASDPPMRAVLIEVKAPHLAQRARFRPMGCVRSLGHPCGRTTAPPPGRCCLGPRVQCTAMSATPSS